jgi:integrase
MAEKKHTGVFQKVKGSGVYWVRYTDATGVRRKKKIGSFGNAVKVYDKRSSEARLGVIPPGNDKTKFAELVEDAKVFADSHHASAKDFRQRVELALPQFGERLAASITPVELQRWMDATAIDRDWKPGTCNRVKSALSTTFREAQRAGKVQTNPARLIRRVKEPLGRVRFLSYEEEAKLREAICRVIKGRLREGKLCLYQLDIALNTGMRRGEQFSATWDQVDLERGFIYLSKTKNGSDQFVHLNSKAKQVLTELKAIADERGLGPDDRLFLGRRGKPILEPKKWFGTPCKLAKVENVTWHTLRHTFASRLVMAGVDLKTVQELMGHKSIAMTARYSHLAPSHKLAALEKLVGPDLVPSAFLGETKTLQVEAK